MIEHTPTPWEGEPENWMSVNDATGEWHHSLICQVNGKKRPEANANRERIIACVNAFHSPDGRTIATEDIAPGVVFRLHDTLNAFMQRASVLNVLEDDEREQARALLSSLKIERPGE